MAPVGSIEGAARRRGYPRREPGASLESSDRHSKLSGAGAHAGWCGLDSEENIRGLICNPIYAGVGPFPGMIRDEVWIGAAAKLIREEGPEQFLVNMLHVLRRSFEALDTRHP